MGDASLRVQTKYPSTGELLRVVGPSLQRGSLRVPVHVAFDQPFALILVSLDGEEAISGTAEVVEHAGDATWVRFLSAAPDSTTEPARCVLVDTEVMSPVALTAKAEAFEAVVDQPIPTERPAVESRPIIVHAPALATDLSMPALDHDARATDLTMPALDATDDARVTVAAPQIVASLAQMTSGDDAVAMQRGIRAITNPAAKTGRPSSRRIVIAAASIAAVSLVVAAGSIMWAHDAVAHAERVRPSPAQAPVAKIVERPPVAVEQPPAPGPACTLDVFSSVADASVYVDGAATGSTPATATVECGKAVDVEIRHPRYETFRRTVTPTGREEVRATLEREKRR